MKKLTFILISVIFIAFKSFSGHVNFDGPANAEYQITPEGRQIINKISKHHIEGIPNEGDQTMTRSFNDNDGNVWNISVLLTQIKVSDILYFQDASTGETITYGFDRLPYYVCNFLLYSTDAKSSNFTSYITFVGCWPSKYIYEQIFNYTGELTSDGAIPEALRDYDPVSMDELANNADYTNNFRESPYIGSDVVSGTKKFEFWTLLENATASSGGTCTINLEEARTYCTDTIGSSFLFESFYKDTNELECKIQIYVQVIDSGSRIFKGFNYLGKARIEGFEPIITELPEFGDMHLFNAGLMSSSSFGQLNPFTGEWGPYTVFYMAIGDKYVDWRIDSNAVSFSPNIIEPFISADASSDHEHANSLYGYLFASVKYANGVTYSPDVENFKCIWPSEGEKDGNPYTEIVPIVNSFTPGGFNSDAWSDEYGMHMTVENIPDMIAADSQIVWGTKNGFEAKIGNNFKKTVKIKSSGNIIYHYDPTDISKVRHISMTGTSSGIEYEDPNKLMPQIIYDGRYISFKNDIDESKIKVTFSTEGKTGSEYYKNGEKIDVKGIGKINLEASATGYSTVTSAYDIEYYSDGNYIETSKAGLLSQALKWMNATERNSVKELTLKGKVFFSDFTTLINMSSLTTLDMSNLDVIGGTISSALLKGINSLRYVILPINLESANTLLSFLSKNQNLSAIKWGSPNTIPSAYLSLNNKNLLIYTETSSAYSGTNPNIIYGGKASNGLSLTSGYPFYCPEEFTAEKAEITRNFDMTSGIYESQGWETISLPFTADKFQSANKGAIVPFATAQSSDLAFWLYTMNSNGWVAASK